MQGFFAKKWAVVGKQRKESARGCISKKTHYRPKLSSYLPDLTLYFRPRQQKSFLIYFALGEKGGEGLSPLPAVNLGGHRDNILVQQPETLFRFDQQGVQGTLPEGLPARGCKRHDVGEHETCIV